MNATTARILSTTALAVAALAALELAGTLAIGFAVDTDQLNVLTKQGYAFLTQMEKSPLGLMLVVAAAIAMVVLHRERNGADDGRSQQLARVALWAVLTSAVVLGIGTVLGVMARFRVAEVASGQPVDPVTRRVLVVYVVRNFGLAVTALLIALNCLTGRREPTAAVVEAETPVVD